MATNAIRVWENIYVLSDLESRLNDGSLDSLKQLSEQFSTISEMIPEDVDPADDFELYVVGKLSQRACRVISSFLSSHRSAISR